MPTAEQNCALYTQLAEKYHGKGRFQERDRFLILAADTAWNAGDVAKAEALRRRIMEYNPSHLLKPYPSLEAALKSPDILAYVQQLRRGYPRERALELLKELDATAKPMGGDEDQERTYSTEDTPAGRGAAAPSPWANPGKPAEAAKAPAPLKPMGFGKTEGVEEKPKVVPFSLPPSQVAAIDKKPAKEAPVTPREKNRPSMQPLEAVLPPMQPGSWIGEILFALILILSLVGVGYLFVFPLI